MCSFKVNVIVGLMFIMQPLLEKTALHIAVRPSVRLSHAQL